MPTEVEGVQGRNWYVLLAGLPPPGKVLLLGSGLALRPLADQLSVFDLAAAGAQGFRGWALLEPVASACTCEIESAQDSATLPGYDSINRAWLASTLLMLRGFTQHLPVASSGYSWAQVAGHTKRASPTFRQQVVEEGVDAAVFSPRQELPTFRGQILDFHVRVLLNSNPRTDGVTEDDAEWIRNHYDVFNSLAAESDRFRLALEAAVDWRYAKEGRSAVARLWGGIEAVFGLTSELVFRISLLSANLLESDPVARQARFGAIKRLYNLRSKAVHGDNLTDEQLARALDESYELLSQLLLLAIEKGHALGTADFNEALFG